MSLHRHSYSSMIKFGVVRGPLDVVPMTRLKVDEGRTRAAPHCTFLLMNFRARPWRQKNIHFQEVNASRLEAFTSFPGEGKTALGLDDLQDPVSSCKSDGFKAITA